MLRRTTAFPFADSWRRVSAFRPLVDRAEAGQWVEPRKGCFQSNLRNLPSRLTLPIGASWDYQYQFAPSHEDGSETVERSELGPGGLRRPGICSPRRSVRASTTHVGPSDSHRQRVATCEKLLRWVTLPLTDRWRLRQPSALMVGYNSTASGSGRNDVA